MQYKYVAMLFIINNLLGLRSAKGTLSPARSLRGFTLQLDVTNACNLACSHCYHPNHNNEGALTLDQWKKVVDQHVELCRSLNRSPRFIICGGEPLSYRSLIPLLQYLAPLQMPRDPILILSNGTLVSERLAQSLRPFDVAFQISLDGPDAARHDPIRGPGAFAKAVRGISILHSAGIGVQILSVLSDRSRMWVRDFFELAKSLNVSRMSFTRLIPEGHAKRVGAGKESGTAPRPLPPDQLKDAYHEIWRAAKETGISTGTNKPLYHLIDPTIGKSGRWGFDAYVVDYKGNLKISSRIPVTVGNVLTDGGLEHLFLRHPTFRALRAGKVEKCGACKHFFECGGDRNAAFAEFGSVLAPDPGCWV